MSMGCCIFEGGNDELVFFRTEQGARVYWAALAAHRARLRTADERVVFWAAALVKIFANGAINDDWGALEMMSDMSHFGGHRIEQAWTTTLPLPNAPHTEGSLMGYCIWYDPYKSASRVFTDKDAADIIFAEWKQEEPDNVKLIEMHDGVAASQSPVC